MKSPPHPRSYSASLRVANEGQLGELALSTIAPAIFSRDDDDSHKNNDTEDDHNNDYDNDKVGAINHLTSSSVVDDDNDTYDDDNNDNDNNKAGKDLDCCFVEKGLVMFAI